MDLFSVPPTQTVIDRGSWEKINPIAGLAVPYEFEISGTGDQYIDLEETQLYVKCQIVKADGTDLVAADKVGPINYSLHSLFKQVDVSLNGQEISDSSSMYPYRAYLEALLNYGDEAKKGHLSSALYYQDTAGKLDVEDPTLAVNGNHGLQARAAFFKESADVELMGRLHSDIFHTNRQLMNGVNVRIKFIPSSDAFVLMGTARTYKMKIKEIALYVRRVTPSSTLMVQHAKILASGTTAKYPIQRVQMKSKPIQNGTTNIVSDHFWLGQLPRRLVFGIVGAPHFNGDFAKNPFHFQHFKVSEVTLRYAGQLYPTEPLKLDFAETDTGPANKSIRGYDSLFTALHKKSLNDDFGISRGDYEKGFTLYAFDFTPDFADGAHYSRKEEGSLDLSIRFKEALTEGAILICYAEFDNIIEIDRYGNVSFDFIR